MCSVFGCKEGAEGVALECFGKGDNRDIVEGIEVGGDDSGHTSSGAGETTVKGSKARGEKRLKKVFVPVVKIGFLEKSDVVFGCESKRIDLFVP